MRLLAAALVFSFGLAALPAANAQVANPRLKPISGGGFHTCALTDGGRLKCWGDNTYGQLGDGTRTERLTPVSTVGLGDGLKSVAAGISHTCVLTGAGGIKCWGYRSALGDGAGSDRYTPAFVQGISSGAIAVASGRGHACALLKTGNVKCWGENSFGQLGDGTKTASLVPVPVKGLRARVIAIAAGNNHTCAIEDTGLVKCWGSNISGQLGDGTVDERLKPAAVLNLRKAAAIAASISDHTCALTEDGAALCWGSNLYGQLGDGTLEERRSPVAVIELGRGVRAIATGQLNTCAVLNSGGGRCWGYNFHGSLGDNSRESSSTPVTVLGLNGTSIAAGIYHNCSNTKSGRVACWGLNDYGQVGNGDKLTQQVPVQVKRF